MESGQCVECNPGTHYDNTLNQCIPNCVPGTHYDFTFNQCVPNCPHLKNLPPNGDCACPSIPGGTPTACGDKCVDTNTDENNCGMCGNDCTIGYTCNGGLCKQPCSAGECFCDPDDIENGCIDTPTGCACPL